MKNIMSKNNFGINILYLMTSQLQADITAVSAAPEINMVENVFYK